MAACHKTVPHSYFLLYREQQAVTVEMFCLTEWISAFYESGAERKQWLLLFFNISHKMHTKNWLHDLSTVVYEYSQ